MGKAGHKVAIPGALCDKCGNPPGPRDKGILERFAGQDICGNCLCDYDDEADMVLQREVVLQHLNASPMADWENAEKMPYWTARESQKIHMVAKQCGVVMTREEWRDGVRK
jgi:hypothetical protein